MIEWLKSSILGIVILGALGSLLAWAFIKAVGWFVRRVVQPAADSYLARLFVRKTAPRYLLEHLSASADPREVAVASSFYGTRLTLDWIGVFGGLILICLGTAVFRLSPGDSLAVAMTFAGSFSMFTSVSRATRNARMLSDMYDMFVGDANEAAKVRAEGEYGTRGESG